PVAHSFTPPPRAPPPTVSVALTAPRPPPSPKPQAASRSPSTATTLTPDDPNVDRHSTGPWTGSYTIPVDPNPGVPYCPILITGPLWFPITAGARVDFAGRVDVPFYSMDGWAGRRDMVNPSPPPPYITDPSTIYGDGGTNWERYFILGAVNSVKQFIVPIAANATWSASVVPAPAGSWSFQIITYANQAD